MMIAFPGSVCLQEKEPRRRAGGAAERARETAREPELTQELGKPVDPLGIRKDMLCDYLSRHTGIQSKLQEEQKQITNAIIEKIVVYDDSLRFEWRLRIQMAKADSFDTVQPFDSNR